MTDFEMDPTPPREPEDDEKAGGTGEAAAGGAAGTSGEDRQTSGGVPEEALPPLPPRADGQMDLGDGFAQEPIAPRVYYSIGEVCDLTGLKPHVLRYWESQFEVMNPTKNRAGNRVYRKKDIDLVFLVKRLLYEEKYTIEGARQRLLELRSEGDLEEEKAETLGPEFLAEMRRELLALTRILTLPGDAG